MPKVARIFLFILAGLFSAGCLLGLLAWLFIDSDGFKGHLEKTASQVLGMTAEVQGSSRILVWPVPGLQFEELSISNGDSEWLKASALKVRVKIMPMIRGRLELVSVDLVAPNLRLERIEKGKFNFISGQAPEASGQARPLIIPIVEVSDLTLSFTDRILDKQITVENCDWTVYDMEWRLPRGDNLHLNLPDFQNSNLTCSRITSSNLEAAGVTAEISVQNRQIKISQVTGQFLGGEVGGWMKSDFAGSLPHHSLALELAGFQIDGFMKTFREEKGAEGKATFITQLDFSGKSYSEIVAGLNGRAEITGTDIILYGLDIDKQLANYRSTQQFQLVDAAAFFVAGPFGIAISRGYGFTSLFGHPGE
ncbi:MAG: AsmA family protein, partial [Desulfotignum sp.]